MREIKRVDALGWCTTPNSYHFNRRWLDNVVTRKIYRAPGCHDAFFSIKKSQIGYRHERRKLTSTCYWWIVMASFSTAFSSQSNFCLLDLWDLQYSLVISGEFCSQKNCKSGYLFLYSYSYTWTISLCYTIVLKNSMWPRYER